MLYLESLNHSMHELMKNNTDVYVIGEDIVDPYGGAFKVTKGLSTEFPERVLSTPISEAAITGFATGLALRGYKPILEIMFGDFITLCADQIINGATKFSWMYGGNFEVPIVIRTPMGGNRGYGPTHSQTLEHLFFGVPGLFIVAPSLFHNAGDLLKSSVLKVNQPLLFIENKILYPMKLKTPTNDNYVDKLHFESVALSDKLFPTTILKTENTDTFDVSIITYGGLAQKATNAAIIKFIEDETSIQVIIPSLIKPIPKEDIINSIKNSNNIMIVEENPKYSGWGTELSCLIYESLNKTLNTPIQRIGARELPIPSSRPLEKLVLPQEDDIQRVLNRMTK